MFLSRILAAIVGAIIMALLAIAALRAPPLGIVVKIATKLVVVQKLLQVGIRLHD
jgi:hypothetical protein